ncbi:MAG: TIM barrel protein [Christensenellaceae bacterium]
MNNRISVTTIEQCGEKAPLVFRGDVFDAIKKAKQYGYDALEIHVRDAKTFDTAGVKKCLAENGIVISTIVTGQIYVVRKYCLTSPDEQNRKQAMAEMKAYIDIAAELGAKDGVILGWIRGDRPEGDDGTYDRLLSAAIKELAEYAGSKGQRLLVEVINRYEVNTFNTAQELLDFINKYNLENVYIHMDCFHMNIDEADMAESIRICGDKMGYLHMADSNRHYPGAGHTDFIPIIKACKEVGYEGSFSLECIPIPDSDTSAREGFKAIRAMLDAVK